MSYDVSRYTDEDIEHSIAILSLACRLPGARDHEALWRNLAAGVESITFWSDEELLAAGVDPELLASPNFVKANPTIDDVELFDAAFFDYSPREAEILDPQSRIFLECCWEALERAGYAVAGGEHHVGVFAGTSFSTYMRSNVETRPDVMAAHGWFPIYLANDRDYFTTRISYKLDLKGPSMNIQTACSTSLVAVHQACQALFDYQCHLALAGGVRVGVPRAMGYLYEPGGITSPDGHCRSFDARGEGSLFGSGAGVVLLKRLADALEDRDRIAAVVRGSAINNDGSAKVGFTAPSIEGQAEVVAMAQEVAGVAADTVTYVEAHGSGTKLGDPIEVAALTDAFRASTGRRGYCALGSVKSNFGHLEAAAGIAGLIKTVLALEHRQIPPSLHFEEPNPEIDFDDSPFFVNTELRPWESGGVPRRAGVSSFGMGGTNAHVILEEAPEPLPPAPSRPGQLLLLSARTASALDAATERLAEHLEGHPEDDLADVAYTLQAGRRAFAHRRSLVAGSRREAVELLRARQPGRVFTGRPGTTGRPVAFLFSGLGEQYPGMGLGLYRHEPVFRDTIDRCAELLEPRLGADLRSVLYPGGTEGEEQAGGLDLARMLGRKGGAESGLLGETRYAQPAVFAVEVAVAELWKSWGVEPRAVIGHSLGEYAAAHVAGMLGLEDALALVAERARLIGELPAGAMLAVPLAAAEVEELLGEELSLAAVNGPEVSVVAGPVAAVERLAESLADREVICQRLPTSHAFHSRMMEPAAAGLAELARGRELRAPEVPLLSNVTGTWITAEEATDPEYWGRHLCGTVRFARGVGELLAESERVLIEVGPGHGLGALVLQHPAARAGGGALERVVLPSLRSGFDRRPDRAFLLETLGRAWLAGVDAEWRGVHGEEPRARVHLPTYPFERRRFWIEPGRPTGEATGESAPAEPEEAALELHERPALATEFAAPESELERQLAEIWQDVLGIAPVGRHDNYFDMGGHSLLAPKLMLRVGRAVGLEVPLQALLDHPTVAGLGAAVERARREGSAAFAGAELDLAAEVELAAAIRPLGEVAEGWRDPAAVLLTGGTGFLGAYLIDELARRTDARLYCLVRAADEEAARARLRRRLEDYRLWRAPLAERLTVVVGDLKERRFGLGEEAFAELAESVDAIYHAGAWVNFTYPYSALAPTNVEGTREALRLACLGTPKPFHFVSSTAVFTPEAYSGGAAAREDDPLERTEGLFSGYAQTKWVVEKILALARERGLPVAIYRPGVISGHSETGVGNTTDMVWNFLKGSIQLGAALAEVPPLDVTPVDYVARAIVHLSRTEGAFEGVFHFANPRPMPWSEIVDVIEELGYPLRRVEYPEWRRELVRAAEAGTDNALVPFLPLYPEVPEDEAGNPADAEMPVFRYDDRHTRAELAATGIECPPLEPKVLRAYLEYFIASGFLEAPPAAVNG